MSRNADRTYPTHSVESAMSPFAGQVRQLTSLPASVLSDNERRQHMFTAAKALQDAMETLHRSTNKLEEDLDMGMTAILVEDITMSYNEAVRKAGGLVKTLGKKPLSTSEAVSMSKGIESFARQLQTALLSALLHFDQSVVIRITTFCDKVAKGIEKMQEVLKNPLPTEIESVLGELTENIVRLAELMTSRITDLKNVEQQAELDSCRVTLEHCYKSLMSSVKVQLHHPELAITEMNCLAVMDNLLEIAKVVSSVARTPYNNSMWQNVNALAQSFEELERLVSRSCDSLTEETSREECSQELRQRLNKLVLHAKQVAESPRTGDNAGQRLLCCSDEAQMALQNLLDIAEGRMNQGQQSLAPRIVLSGFNGEGEEMPPVTTDEAVDELHDRLRGLRQQFEVAFSHHMSAAVAQMQRDRHIVDHLSRAAAIRNNPKMSDYSAQLLRQMDRFEEVVTAVCGFSDSTPDIIKARRALSQLRTVCPQAVAAAHVLFQFPASKSARSNMASFEHAWHAELDQLVSALKGMGPLDQAKAEAMLDRSKSLSAAALSGPRLAYPGGMSRARSVSSFSGNRSMKDGRIDYLSRTFLSQPDVTVDTL